MYTEMALTARKFALTLAVAGIATMGSVALAPAASAAPLVQDGPGSVIEKLNGNGPDQFLILEHGRKPIFICDEDGKHANKCIDLTGTSRF
jgi:hypothetical protein